MPLGPVGLVRMNSVGAALRGAQCTVARGNEASRGTHTRTLQREDETLRRGCRRLAGSPVLHRVPSDADSFACNELF
eukprot:COSAG03_NODE_275_length_9561_cov_4.812408_3_plen_77_part_00